MTSVPRRRLSIAALRSVLPLALFQAGLVSPATAQSAARGAADVLDVVVVSATRAPDGVPRDLLGASVTTLEAADLRDRQVRAVADVLRDVPGVAVNRAGPFGAVTQVRLRGTEANHALVLIDGMEGTDPYFGEFDFATLIADEVARVEVLRGQMSALYGSDAIGGVIHYMTLSGREAPGLSSHVEGGSFGTYDAGARFAGVTGPLDYALSAGFVTTAGSPTSRFGSRDIGADNRVVSGRVVWSMTDNLRLRGIARYTRARADFNQQDFDFTSPTYGYVVDTDDTSDGRMLQGLLAAELHSLGGRLQQVLTLQGADAARESFASGAPSTADEGQRLKASYVSSLRFDGARQTQRITFALDQKRESFRNSGPFTNADQALKRHLDNFGIVGQYTTVIAERVGLDFALRHDRNDHFRNATTFRLQGTYRLDGGLRLRAAAGSGIKNPSPTELFGYDPQTFIGNPDLKPEKSTGWELGLEQTLLDGRLLVGAAWADSRLHDEIYTIYSPTFVASPANRLASSRQRTAELFAQARFGTAWRVDASYTYLDATEDGLEEVRRPPHIGSVNAVWQSPGMRWGAQFGLRYNGSTDDSDFTTPIPSRVRLASYALLHLGGRFRLSERIEAFGRIENLLDESYEDVYTYRTPGRGYYLGLRAGF